MPPLSGNVWLSVKLSLLGLLSGGADQPAMLRCAGVLPLMQESWRHLAADIEQQQRALMQRRQHPDTTQQPGSTAQQSMVQAVLHLAHLASLAGALLQLWTRCFIDNLKGPDQRVQEQPSKLNVAVSTVAYMADVATGIAAIWRSEGALQQWRTASGNLSAAAPATPARGSSATLRWAVTAAHRVQQSARLLADKQAGELAAEFMVSAVTDSLHAAKKLTIRSFMHMERHAAAGKLQLPGSGAAHDLQWVMLVYAALLVGELHQQQQGLSAVQLHTTDTSSSSSRSSAGSSKKVSRAQQASTSSSTGTRVPSKQQQGSTVPPYHLQVLQAAGVTPHSLKWQFDSLKNHSLTLIESSIVPTALLVLATVLHELDQHLQHTGVSPAAAAAGADTGTSSGRSRTTTSSSSSNSSPTDGSTRPLVGGAAAVLALLAPCSLMWGELFVLFAGSGAAEVQLRQADWAFKQVWQITLDIFQQQAAAKPISQVSELLLAAEVSGVQLPPGELQQQQLDKKLRRLQMVACQDSWYKSCVELIVPALLHARAVGTLDSAHYAASAKFWFGRLDGMLDACIRAMADGKCCSSCFSTGIGSMTCNCCTMHSSTQ